MAIESLENGRKALGIILDNVILEESCDMTRLDYFGVLFLLLSNFNHEL